jgi:hypothetical protein
MTTGSINPRVVAWARTRGIDPKALVRSNPDDEQYRVERVPWTIPYSEWITAKWAEWQQLCTHVPDRKHPFCDHCHNHEKFDAWLQETTS